MLAILAGILIVLLSFFFQSPQLSADFGHDDQTPVEKSIVYGQPNPSQPQQRVRRRIEYEGHYIIVDGIALPNGNVRWEPSEPFNQAALANIAYSPRVKETDGPSPAYVPKRGTANYGLMPHPLSGGATGDMVYASSKRGAEFIHDANNAQAEAKQGKNRLTIIGTDEERNAVLRDLKSSPELAGMADNLAVMDYPPGHWAIDPKLGFQGGTPAIILQSPKSAKDPKGGRVLWRSTDYSKGPRNLSFEIRAADPDYDPAKDNGIRPGSASKCPLGFTSDHYPAIGIAVVVFLFICSAKRGVPRA